MPDDDSTVYSTKQVADSLGLGSAMIRKYAVSLEKLTGADIPIKRRDGRQFGPEHYAVIAHAKALVDGNQGLSVETALKMALGTAEISSDALAPAISYGNSPELVDALTAAVARGNQELLAEVRQLRLDIARLGSSTLNETTQKETGSGEKQDDRQTHGLLVRAALWVEQWWRGIKRSDG